MVVDFQGRTARLCTSGACVAVDRRPEVVYLADTKDNHLSTILELSPERFDMFLQEVTGTLAVGSNGVLSLQSGKNEMTISDQSGRSLTFDDAEWRAFVRGVAEDDFAVERYLTSM